MLNRVAFTVFAGVLLCGCTDSPEAITDGFAKPATTSGQSVVEKQPSDATSRKVFQFNGPRDVIVAGHITVDVMEVVSRPRAIELAQRLQQAARVNPNWWLEHQKKAEPGEPLPYDSRLGLSKDEYNEFLVLSKMMTTQKKAEATLIVATADDDVYVLDGGQALPDFTGIEIDLKNDLIRTPFGTLIDRSEIDVAEGSALGAWVGTQWKFENAAPNGVPSTVAKLGVGRLKKSGRCVIYYDVKLIGTDGNTRISHILNFTDSKEQHGH